MCIRDRYSALSRCISKALSYCPCVTRGSHSFTCHPHKNHTCLYSLAACSWRHRCLVSTGMGDRVRVPFPVWDEGITQFYLPPMYSLRLRRDGRAELIWVDGYMPRLNVPHGKLNPDTVTHHSTNQGRRRLTSLIETNALALHQIKLRHHY